MARKVHECEYCGDDLGGEVEKSSGEIVTCGKRECQRWEQEQYAERREYAHEQLDRDLGY